MKKNSEKKNEKETRILEIKEMIRNFCDEYLNDEIKSYALKLTENIGRRRKIDILRGKKEIWAAAIIYVIARINFLFDRANENYITYDTICDYFNTVKSTTGNKASQIQDICKIEIGTEGYCRQVIIDTLTFVQTPEGFIVPKKWFENREIKIETATDEEEEEIRQFEEKQKQIELQKVKERRERRTEINREIARKKKEKKDKYQLRLFDDF